ncbi:serine/threonine-protein kinase [Polyangium jinanense]|uniref:non-specific serine/threonine protein kinase n=1 Tax=Polyangium jinanense TaxID=2829994 RepID=A0A9X4ASW6_9BACT|nr:serine/threonine-protein kinase [Polyangium jinanense]MDC3955321.1 protein kinase [Polyangium jinanense]MDC3981622.1 protein kinase [Polyangium jinanense]
MKYGRLRRNEPGQTQDATVGQAEPPRAPPIVGGEATAPASAVTPKLDAPRTEPLENIPPDAGAETSEIPPTLYSRFEAFEFLGRGGMGAVYKARDFRLGREVAIKLLFGADPELGGSMLREARSQARITHENVCEVYEAGTADHVRFIVMQLLHGEPLDKARSAMTLEEKIRVVRQVASALHEAHRLGLVHRDVKPANIMVERGEDGAWKPYIMDFGLAREMGDTGATVTGALMGTPSFMAPEQAAGKVRSLDRRTDVYCLGATLYDVLAGRPPIVADNLAALLQGIVHDEPPAVRQIDRDVPQDLEAIVMKCLEKQPSARYESAKALGDDLQRFLDGDPVEARRQSLGYVLWKRARRHKGKVALASVALVVAAVLVGAWIRERQRAAHQATLSREIGESVKEMEFFLRNAYGLPLHDVDRERRIVRERLLTIASWMDTAVEISVGPGHYALGCGYLALQEHAEALAHLKQAEAAGYRYVGLDYSMGMALSEIYKNELADTKRMEGERQKQRIAVIEAEYKLPALVHLKAALGGKIAAPAYVEGLIAYHEGRHEEALAKAREAFEKAPWLYEARKLEGDVLFAMGRKYGHDAAFDHEKMSHWFGQAGEAYRAAADIGSSDPAVHVAMCELFTQEMNGARAAQKPLRPSFAAAQEACGRAIAASPATGLGHLQLAQLHSHFAWHVAVGDAPDEQPEVAIAKAIEHAEEAARRSAEGEPMAWYIVAAVWRTRVLHASDRGLDVVPAVDHAISAYDEALKRDPVFVWALNESCSAYYFRAQHEFMHGIDARRSIEEGLRRCDKAVEIDPSFSYAKLTAIDHRLLLAEQMVAAGQFPRDVAQEAETLIEAFLQQSPRSSVPHRFRATLALIEATHLLESGGDPTPALLRADAGTEEHARLAPTSTHNHNLRGRAATIRAQLHFERGEDPSPWILEARDAFGKAMKARPNDLKYRVWGALVETIALRWAVQRDKASDAEFDAVIASVLPLLDVKRAEPRLYVALGEIHELRGRFRSGRDADAETEIAKGLGFLTQALSMHPRMSSALACKGRLLLLRATVAKGESEAREAAKMSLEAFSAATRENPLVERMDRQAIETARRLAR